MACGIPGPDRSWLTGSAQPAAGSSLRLPGRAGTFAVHLPTVSRPLPGWRVDRAPAGAAPDQPDSTPRNVMPQDGQLAPAGTGSAAPGSAGTGTGSAPRGQLAPGQLAPGQAGDRAGRPGPAAGLAAARGSRAGTRTNRRPRSCCARPGHPGHPSHPGCPGAPGGPGAVADRAGGVRRLPADLAVPVPAAAADLLGPGHLHRVREAVRPPARADRGHQGRRESTCSATTSTRSSR